MTDLIKILNNPEDHYPGNFDTPQRANAMLTGLCQDAANEIERLNAEVLEQCRINGMSAEREDALRAELTRLKASIALDKKAENARELGLDYEPAVQEKCFLCGERVDSCASDVCPKSAQPAVQEPVAWVNHGENRITRATGWDGYGALCKCVCATPPAAQPAPVQGLPFGVGGGLVAIKTLLGRDPCVHANTAIEMIDAILKEHPAAQPAVHEGRDWSLLAATQESLREHMAEIKRLKAAQPAPVQHDECVVCGDKVRVIPRPWVGLSEEEVEAYDSWADFQVGCGRQTLFDMVRDIEAKLKEKNHG